MNKYIIVLAMTLAMATSLHAAGNKSKLISAWSTDCSDLDNNRWFAVEKKAEDQYRFIICARFQVHSLPGFPETVRCV